MRPALIFLALASLLTGCVDRADNDPESLLHEVNRTVASGLGLKVQDLKIWTHTQECTTSMGTPGAYTILDWHVSATAGVTAQDMDDLEAEMGATPVPAGVQPPEGSYQREFLLRAGEFPIRLITTLDRQGIFGLSMQSPCI